MLEWDESPIVTFSRNGSELTLGRDGEEATIHLNGSEGFGLAPVEIEKSDRLGGDGSIVRGVRYGDREVYVPLFVRQPSTGDLHEWRRNFTRLLAPVSGDPEASIVDVTITDPTTGTERTARGIYTGGLEGEFGSDYHGDWQTLGVTLECHDPWWLGPERLRTLKVAPGTKPFLSRTTYSRRNYARNPRMDSLTGQLGAGQMAGSSGATLTLSTEWASQGSTSLMITPNGTNNSSAARLMLAGDDLRGAEFAGKTVTAAVDIHLEEAQTGSLSSTARSILVGYVSASGAETNPTANWSTPAPNEAGTHRIATTVAIPADARGIYIYVRNGATAQPMWVDALTIEDGATSGEYFDGDTEGAIWDGEPGASTSGVVEHQGTPFFPIVLSQSNVVGEWDIDVAGDGQVWPSWEVTGPGRDLLIQCGDQRLSILGEFPTTPTLIQTRPRRITPRERFRDLQAGSTLFPLQPGPNRIKVEMTGADANTTVRLVYRERYLEGI